MEKMRFISLKVQVPTRSRYLEYAKFAFSVFGPPFNLARRFILSQPRIVVTRERTLPAAGGRGGGAAPGRHGPERRAADGAQGQGPDRPGRVPHRQRGASAAGV